MSSTFFEVVLAVATQGVHKDICTVNPLHNLVTTLSGHRKRPFQRIYKRSLLGPVRQVEKDTESPCVRSQHGAHLGASARPP